MNVRKAVITAAGVHQRALPLQMLIDRDGIEKPILRILLEEVFAAPIEEACLIVAPGDRASYARAAGDLVRRGRALYTHNPHGIGGPRGGPNSSNSQRPVVTRTRSSAPAHLRATIRFFTWSATMFIWAARTDVPRAGWWIWQNVRAARFPRCSRRAKTTSATTAWWAANRSPAGPNSTALKWSRRSRPQPKPKST